MAPADSIILNEIRALAGHLAMGRPVQAGQCAKWTGSHLRLLRLHGLLPWIHVSLAQQAKMVLPAHIVLETRNCYRQSAIRSLLREECIREILEQFQAGGIDLIVLKGGYLGPNIYGDAAQRPMDDLDILVAENHRQPAREILISLGYEAPAELTDELEESVRHSQCYVKEGRSREFVDLHWRLQAMDYYRLPSQIVWDNWVESTLHGHKVHYLTPEMNFIHLAIHTLNHGQRLRDWLDLILLTQRTHMSWEGLMKLAESMRVVRPIYHVLYLLETQWNFTPPSGVLRRAASYNPHWLEDRVIRGRIRLIWRWISRLSSLPDWRSRLHYIRTRFMAPRQHGKSFVGIPGLLWHWVGRTAGLLRSIRRV